MAESMNEYLDREMTCEGLLECAHGLTELDREVFVTLAANSEPMTVDAIASAVERERSTAYRSIQRLLGAGFVSKQQVNYEAGGYYHVFKPADADQIAHNLQRLLNDWYAEMGQLIEQFRRKYAIPSDTATTEQ